MDFNLKILKIKTNFVVKQNENEKGSNKTIKI